MNALVCIKPNQFTKLDDGLYELLGRVACEQAPDFFVVEDKWSFHKITSASFGGKTYHVLIAHGPRAGFKALKEAGIYVQTLREVAGLPTQSAAALRAAWPYWLVDGALTTDEGDVAVSDYPLCMTGGPALGQHGSVCVDALVRPYVGITTLGYEEDYDGEDAGVD